LTRPLVANVDVTVSRPRESHPGPLSEPYLVGIEPRRAHLVITGKATFPRAPLQSRKVGFPNSGFRLGFPRETFPRGLRLKLSLAYTPLPSGLPPSSSKTVVPPACAVAHSRTAKCSELLCRSQALLATGWHPAPPRRALPLLPRSYELMRQTSSLLRTSCSPLISRGLCRLLRAPAGN
jgi:hypothetical protein